MKIFTIENETNNITRHATIQDAEAVRLAHWAAMKQPSAALNQKSGTTRTARGHD